MPLLYMGPTADSTALIKKHNIDISDGIKHREEFAEEIEKQARENLNKFNSYGRYEKELVDKFNALRDCKDVDKITPDQFKGNAYGPEGISHPEKLFNAIQNACKKQNGTSIQEVNTFVNGIIENVNKQYTLFVDRFNQQIMRLNLDEFRSTLEKYKRGTEAFKEIPTN